MSVDRAAFPAHGRCSPAVGHRVTAAPPPDPGRSPWAARTHTQDRTSWSPRQLLEAPHRLAFFLAVVVLVASGLWWSLVQLGRQPWGPSVPLAMSPTVTHAAVMSLGFFPVFFAGFLFTAGPKWLGVAAPNAQRLLWPLGLQCTGWLLWLVGAIWMEELAWSGLALATVGLLIMAVQFWQLVHRSPVADRLHAQLAGVACGVGAAALLGTLVMLWMTQVEWALRLIRSGLWGCVVVTFLVVAHRMLPFFTASAVPTIAPWRPRWVLWFLLGIAALETVATWAPLLLAPEPGQGMRTPRAWMLALGLTELAAGSLVVWLALTWGLVQSFKVRLLAMLHVGFAWFGVALLLSGASQLLGLRQGVPLLGLGALHALTMGFLGSVLLAMVTRVSSGHSGRSLVADHFVWGLFGLLQVATVLRIASALEHTTGWLTLAAATSWLVVMLLWGGRLAIWYGQPRTDGQPG